MSTEKVPMSEASEMLTIGEIGWIEKHYGEHFDPDKMSPMSMMAGIIWAMERRKTVTKGAKKFDWADVNLMTMKEAEEYFAPEPIELDPDDPESESGEDDAPAA
jgi:hypothetical protein